MKRTTFSVLFYIKRAKLLKTGEAPIYCRVTVDGVRSEFAIKRSVSPGNWNAQKGKAIGGAKSKELNHFLEHIRIKLYEHQKDIEDKGQSITSETLVLAYQGKLDEEKYLLEVYREHNENLEKLIGKGVAKLTHTRHETSLNHLKTFLNLKYKKKDISFREINNKFVSDYEVYLRGERNCNNNTTVKYIKNFKKIVNIGVNNGWIKTNPFNGIRFKTEQTDKVFLDLEELKRIENKTFSIDRIEQVKDIFLFCCYTGLSFVDVKNLTDEDIVIGINGAKWIKKHRQKTNQSFTLPLVEKAIAIIEKYSDHPCRTRNGMVLPVLSNQKMNAYLKEVADLCGINKNLTWHSARHTFATTVTLANGIPIEIVSKMQGHSNVLMTMHYARVTEELMAKEMAKLG